MMKSLMMDDELTLMQKQNRSLQVQRQELEREVFLMKERETEMKEELQKVDDAKKTLGDERVSVDEVKKQLSGILDLRMKELARLQTAIPSLERYLLTCVVPYAEEIDDFLGRLDERAQFTASGSSMKVAEEIRRRVAWAAASFFAGRQVVERGRGGDDEEDDRREAPSWEEMRRQRFLSAASLLAALDNGVCGLLTSLRDYYESMAGFLPEDMFYFELSAIDSLGSGLFVSDGAFAAPSEGTVTCSLRFFGRLCDGGTSSSDVSLLKLFVNGTETESSPVRSEPNVFMSVSFSVTLPAANDDDNDAAGEEEEEVEGIVSRRHKCALNVLWRRASQPFVAQLSQPIDLLFSLMPRDVLDKSFAAMKSKLLREYRFLPPFLCPLSLYSQRLIVLVKPTDESAVATAPH